MENPTSTRTSDSLSATLANSIQALGRGFDVTSDIRLLYCKGAPGSRLVRLDENHTRDLEVEVSHGVVVPNVSMDIDCSRGKSGIEKIPVCSFHEVIVFIHLFCLFSRFLFVAFACWEEYPLRNERKGNWGIWNLQFFCYFFCLVGGLACDFCVLNYIL